MGGRGSSRERHFGEDCVSAFEIALDFCLEHPSIATSFGKSEFDGSRGSWQVLNLDQTVLLKSGWSWVLRKYDRHRVSVYVNDPSSVLSTWPDTLG